MLLAPGARTEGQAAFYFLQRYDLSAANLGNNPFGL